MATNGSPFRYRIEFSGDAIEAVMAPVDHSVADYWIEQPGERLFNETFNITDDSDIDPSVPGDCHLPNWRDITNGTYLQGFELHKGSLEVYGPDDKLIYRGRMDTQEFWNRHVDDLKVYTEETNLGSDSPVVTGFVSYTGRASVDLELPDKFDPKLLMLHVVQLPETLQFISRIFYAGNEMTGVDVGGAYTGRCAALYINGRESLVHSE